MTTLNLVFSALADPTRRAILERLARGEATVGQLAEPFEISPPAISRHLKVLEEASLISNQRNGKHRLCRLKPEALARATDWIDFHRRFWIGSFDRLDARLKQEKRDNKP